DCPIGDGDGKFSWERSIPSRPPVPPEIRLRSPHGRADCAARLRAGADSPWAVFGRRPVIGQVGYDYASLRRRSHWRGLVRPCLDVVLLGDQGCELICRPGPHPLVALMSNGWFGFLVTAAGLFALFCIAGGLFERYWLPVAVPAGLVAAAATALYLDRGDPASDHAFL